MDAAEQIAGAGSGPILPVVITANEVVSADIARLHDPKHFTHKAYGAEGACIYLVRPDGYVGFRSSLADVPALLEYLQGNFGISANQVSF
jgi:hypothetical protein